MIIVAAGAIDPQKLVEWRECTVVFASGDTRGNAAAALLLSDYAVMAPSSMLDIGSTAAWAGVIWRIGREAVRIHSAGKTSFTADEASDARLIDEIADDPARCFESRSAVALDAAAMLIGRRGGDALERAEFARLFAIGEPQRGLAAFLGKRRPRF
ncbi:MAG TPA: hypothetical protein VIM68_04660, partial [Thermoanaerobaculia bacterium]